MREIYYDSGTMTVGGDRGRLTVWRTGTGIATKRDSLYSDEPTLISYWRDWPQMPASESAIDWRRWYDTLIETRIAWRSRRIPDFL